MEQQPLLLETKLEQLKESLAEVCREDIARMDTGQLIRVEEVLVVAHETAREVVSIRRKRKRRARSASHETELSSKPVGAHRVFTDPNGTPWDVFAVLPPAEGKVLARLPGPFQQGWLCFDAATEKRRLSPIPGGWENATEDELLHLHNRAIPVPPRTTPPEQRGGLQ